MHTILEYVKQYGNEYTFEEAGLNEVDSLILSQFSYLKFDKLVHSPSERERFVSLQDIAADSQKDTLFLDERERASNIELFEAMCKSKRFAGLKMNYFIDIVFREEEVQTQFSAITFLLPDKTVYVAFRGTDDNLVGWEEDLHLALSKPAPGQIYSVEYLNQIASMFRADFMLGGHSKGGNLAVYSAMNCKPDIQDRILAIYNHDGPGFRPEIRQQCHYERIADRVRKSVPKSSLIGMMLENGDELEVVESRTIGGILQHNPYTWSVKENHFVNCKDINGGAAFLDQSINEWVLSLDEEHMHLFIDTLFDLLEAADIDTLSELEKKPLRNAEVIYEMVKDIDPQVKEICNQIILKLLDQTKEKALKNISEMLTGKTLHLPEKRHKKHIDI